MTVEAASVKQPEHPQTILVAEDEVLIRLVLAEHLRDCGYRVLEAANAFEAIQILTEEIQVDILLADVQMPGEMNGFGLARWTRQHRPKIKVIITSGHEQAAHKASDLCDDEPYIKSPMTRQSWWPRSGDCSRSSGLRLGPSILHEYRPRPIGLAFWYIHT